MEKITEEQAKQALDFIARKFMYEQCKFDSTCNMLMVTAWSWAGASPNYLMPISRKNATGLFFCHSLVNSASYATTLDNLIANHASLMLAFDYNHRDFIYDFPNSLEELLVQMDLEA